MAPRPMTSEHKEAMAAGRAEGRAVKAYLDGLEQQRPRRGRPRTAESIRRRLEALAAELADAASLQRLQLLQERRDLEAELEAKSGPAADLATLEAGFVKVAKAYGERKGIAYATWREMGVPADVLGRGGDQPGRLITPARGRARRAAIRGARSRRSSRAARRMPARGGA